jgi:hypothetical protein
LTGNARYLDSASLLRCDMLGEPLSRGGFIERAQVSHISTYFIFKRMHLDLTDPVSVLEILGRRS